MSATGRVMLLTPASKLSARASNRLASIRLERTVSSMPTSEPARPTNVAPDSPASNHLPGSAFGAAMLPT